MVDLIHPKKWKIWPKFFLLSDINENIFWYISDDFEKKIFLVLRKNNFDGKMFENLSNFFFLNIFFAGGFAPPHPRPGLRAWTPHAFGLRALTSQVPAQRHSRIACYSVCWSVTHHNSNTRVIMTQKIKIVGKIRLWITLTLLYSKHIWI